MQKNRLGRISAEFFARALGKRNNAASRAFENLEARQMLSAELPAGSEWVDWGSGRVAAVADQYLVTFDNYLGNAQAELRAREVATRLGVVAENVKSIGRGGWASFTTAGTVSKAAVERLSREMDGLAWVEPDLVQEVSRVPNDPRLGELWHLENTGQFVSNGGAGGNLGTIGADVSAREAWDITIGSRSVVIAVIDTGVDVSHPDLAANIWRNPGEIAGNGIDDDGNGFTDDINGFDFGTLSSTMTDQVGHGTGVASVIGAVGNDNFGITGINWNVSIMALKIADANGGLSTGAIIGAHDYATMMRTDFGINVVASNNSYGLVAGDFYEDQQEGFEGERAAIARFVASGATFVAAAGNDALDNDQNFSSFPASYNIPGVISVAATDNNDGLAGFSSFGAQTVDVAAPGVNMLLASPGGGYVVASGTSFAAPLVAGIVGLIKSVKPNASAVEIREALINSSDPLPALQGLVRSGGRVNAAAAIRTITTAGPTIRAITPGPVAGQLNPATNQPYSSITIQFTKDIGEAFLSTSAVSLIGDVSIPIASVTRSPTDARTVVIALNLNGFSQQRLPIDTYTLTLAASGFRDTSGNFLNGNTSGGTDETYDFRIIASTGDNEPNDTLVQATPVTFDANSQARFTGVTLGNGVFANLDVDLYGITVPRGGLITAETFAARLPSPSTLDTYLRLFDANGIEIAANDQASGRDSFIDFFVNTGGTYYVGVSGFGNRDYVPATGGSGRSQSLGTYDLALTVQLANDDVVTINSDSDTGLPRRVPAAENQTQGITTSTIVVNDTRQILDVDVRLNITHTFVSDLRISLIGPNNVEIILVNRRGGSGDNFGTFNGSGNSVLPTVFDDEGPLAAASGFAPFTAGNYTPEASLGTFDGLPGNGLWTLRINDTTALNSGFLIDWSLDFTFQNDIFGPFESNDTFATAKNLQEINGFGTAERTAFLGDGGFGSFDRDLFKVTANAGSTLTAVATPTGALNTAIRVFDSTFVEILLANPAASTTARIENFVFANSGVYYIAVTDGANIAYDAQAVNNGTDVAAVSTGTYTLDIVLTPGVSDGATILTGDSVEVGLNTTASFGAPRGTDTFGLRFNGIEFLSAASLNAQFFGGVASGYDFVNSGGDPQIAYTLTVASDTYNNRVSALGFFRGLQIEKTFSFGIADGFVAVDVFLTNTGADAVTGLGWMEGFNPDPGIALGEGQRATRNDVDDQGKFAVARYINNQFSTGLTIALGTAGGETRSKATIVSGNATPRDPSGLIGSPINDPNGASGDDALALSFDLGTLAAGGATSFRYFIFFGTNPTAVTTNIDALNSGTGTGHLASNSANPATEALQTAVGDPTTTAPILPYRQFFSEGFIGNQIFTFLPIANPNAQATRVVVIARYETGVRDQVVGDLTIAGNSRSGLTLITPEIFAAGGALIRTNAPYALEIRSERPVASTFSHYDLALLDGFRAAVGESFTTQISSGWTFGQVTKGQGHFDFLTFYNPNNDVSNVTATFYGASGGTPYSVTRSLAAFRRGGININQDGDMQGLLDGEYGVVITGLNEFVASATRYDTIARTADGLIGNIGNGTLNGVVAEGQLGLNGTTERLGVLNSGSTAATVLFSFIFSNGSAYRTSLSVPASSNASLNVEELPNFPAGLIYGLFYESNVPVSLTVDHSAYNDSVASGTSDQAYSYWGFGEGFRPGDTENHPGVTDYLRLYNPSNTEVTVEIRIVYDGIPGSETFRRTLAARRVTEFNVDQFITGSRRATSQYYGTTVKSPAPIVAYMGHFDRLFPGAFGTIGTPLGLKSPVA